MSWWPIVISLSRNTNLGLSPVNEHTQPMPSQCASVIFLCSLAVQGRGSNCMPMTSGRGGWWRLPH